MLKALYWFYHDLNVFLVQVFTGLPHEDQGVRFVKLETGLKPNSTYAVKLQAMNSIGYSEWSDVCAFTTNKGNVLAVSILTPARNNLALTTMLQYQVRNSNTIPISIPTA